MWSESPHLAHGANRVRRIRPGAVAWVLAVAIVASLPPTTAAQRGAVDDDRFPIPVRVAVFPPLDEARDPDRAAEFLRNMREGFVAHGFQVTDAEDLERFFERHRVRWLGGVSPAIAAAARSEIGVDAVILSSILRLDDGSPPAVSLSSRWVDVRDEPRIRWMEVVSLHGRDQLGFLGQKEVYRVDVLLEEAVSGLFASLRRDFISTDRTTDPTASHRRFAPRAWASTTEGTRLLEPGMRVAMLPFRADGTTRAAATVLETLFLRHLSKSPDIHLIDPGVVRAALLDARIIMTEGPSLDQTDIIGSLLSADLEITGSVRTYVSNAGLDSTPLVEFWTVGFEPDGRQSVWSSFSSNEGTDGVFFFRVGAIWSPEQLTFEMSRAIVHRWATAR